MRIRYLLLELLSDLSILKSIKAINKFCLVPRLIINAGLRAKAEKD
jgi:hypothetical protein